MIHKLKKTSVYLAAEVFLCFCLGQYGIGRIFGFSLFPDEFGYWAPAADLLGWDWTETSALGSYYSFGYSLILAPILYFVKNSTTAYRTAVMINVLLLCVSPGLMYGLLRKLFPERPKEQTALLGGIAILYPAWIFYMQMTMTEGLLLFLFLLICYLFQRFLEKPRALNAILMAVAFVYIYFVHMRSIGTLAAGGAVLLLRAFQCLKDAEDRRALPRILLTIGLMGLLFVLGLGIKDSVLERLYAGAATGAISVNDYSGQWEKLRSLLGIRGIMDFLAGLSAKLLYLGLASFGLVWRGMWLAGKKAFDAVREWRRQRRDQRAGRKGQEQDFFWLFVWLASLAQICVTVIYTLGSVHEGNNRLDLFVHGRYSELIVPVLTALGLVQMLESRRIWRETVLIVGMTGAFTLLATHVAGQVGMDNIHGYFCIGISYLLDEESYCSEVFLWKAWGLGCVLILLVTLILTVYRKCSHMEWLLALVLALQTALGLQASEHYIYIGNSYGYMDIQVANRLLEVLEAEENAGDGGRIIHIYEGDNPYIEQIQFRLRDRKVEIWDVRGIEADLGRLKKQDKVITPQDGRWNKDLDERYGQSWKAGHLCLYYNE